MGYWKTGSFGAVAMIVLTMPALAADIIVVSTDNIMAAFQQLQPMFEARYGDKLTFRRQGAKATEILVESGVAGDVVVGSRPMLEALMARGKLRPGSIVDIAHSSVAVVARAGSATPDISTDNKFKSLLLRADSIVYPDPAKGSLGGNYFARLISQWGIAEQLKEKSQLVAGGDVTARVVADGKAQIGINQISEIRSVPGLAFLAPLPPALTDKVLMSMAILANVRQPKAAQAWIFFVSSPAVAAAIRSHGMDPNS
jgi:molybdate transport system substrate-binding protein